MEQVSISSAYIWSLIVAVVFFTVATVAANLILYKPNNPGTASRRLWFWILCVATGVVAYLINYSIARGITVPSLRSDYETHAAYAAGVGLVLYIAVGFIVSKLFPSSKVGTWF